MSHVQQRNGRAGGSGRHDQPTNVGRDARASLFYWMAILAVCLMGLPAAPARAQGGGDGPKLTEAETKALGVIEAINARSGDKVSKNRFALVIGANDYRDENVPDLPACLNDAKAFAELLQHPVRGRVKPENLTLITGAEVTRQNVVDALVQLARKATANDMVIIFFSGHGATDATGKSYWVAHDTQVEKLESSAVPEKEITERLAQIPAERLIMFIDACYSASTANLGSTKSLLDLEKLYPRLDEIESKQEGSGRVAITASRGDQLSVVINDRNHPGFGHSVFAWHLIEAIRGRADEGQDGLLMLDEIWRYVNTRTEQTSRQFGGEQQPLLKGEISGGNYLFSFNPEGLSKHDETTQQRLLAINSMLENGQITADQYEIGKLLIVAFPVDLDEPNRERRTLYLQLSDGKVLPEHLKDLLAGLEKRLKDSGQDGRANLALMRSRGLSVIPQGLKGDYVQKTAFVGHRGPITAIAPTPDADQVVTASTDRTILGWNLATKKEYAQIGQHEADVLALALDPQERYLASGGADGAIHIWGAGGGLLRTLKGHTGRVTGVAALGDGNYLVSTGEDKTVRIWDVENNKALFHLEGHPNRVTALSVSPNGIQFASGDESGGVKLWDGRTGQKLHELKADIIGPVQALAFSPDGKHLAVGCARGSLRVWSVETGDLVHLLQRFSLKLDALAYRRDGALVSASDAGAGMVKVWDMSAETPKATQTLTTRLLTLIISNDGRRIIGASGAPERKIKVLELK